VKGVCIHRAGTVSAVTSLTVDDKKVIRGHQAPGGAGPVHRPLPVSGRGCHHFGQERAA
jgi:hypothetical protein